MIINQIRSALAALSTADFAAAASDLLDYADAMNEEAGLQEIGR